MDIDGLLLDIDGVLSVSWEPIPGSIDALARLRADGVPLRLITNTTTHTCTELARTLQDAGFDATADDIITAVVATAQHLRSHHPGASVFVLSDGDASKDLTDVSLVAEPEDADVIVIGGACEEFTYVTVNRVFRRLMEGAALVGMHRNLYWRTAGGLELDGGAYIAGLEEAAGVTAAICGKPARGYFEAALEMLGTPAGRTAMVGDDIVNDVLGAQAAGLTGVLVRTGKFAPSDLEKGAPDHIVDSLAHVPDLIRDG